MEKIKKIIKKILIHGNPKVKEEWVVKSFSPAEFESIVMEMIETHNKKNHDYSGGDYLSDLIASRRLGIIPWKNALLRMQQKMSRMESFAKQDELKVKDESVEDTLKDMAVYSILCLILYRNKK